MKNPRKKYWFYRVVSVVVLAVLVFLLKHDLKRLIDTAPLSPSTPETQQLTPPDSYFFSPDSSIPDNGTLSDLDYIDKPTVPLYQYSEILEPNIQKNIDTSGITVERIALKKPEKEEGTGVIQQEQSGTDVFSDLPDIANEIGFSWIANNHWEAINFNLTRSKNRKPSTRIVQVNNNISYHDVGLNNDLDDQAVSSFGNRRIVTHIGNFNYTSQTLYNTYNSDLIVSSIGDYNSTVQNVFNAYNARLTVTQNGSFNRVKQDIYSRDVFGTFNQTESQVRQSGSYNLFRSQQVGVSNTIKTIQRGSFNNVDITQRGNHNSAQVHQSGQGNTVTINQN